MKWKNTLVALSVVLNVALVTYLVTGPGQPPVFLSEAYGQNRAAAGGGYAATTADITSSRQALWVVDNQEKRLVVYHIPPGKKQIDPIAARDLRRDFGENLAGDLMILPGKVSGQADAVYVFDPVGKKLIAYYMKGDELDIVGARDLALDFKK